VRAAIATAAPANQYHPAAECIRRHPGLTRTVLYHRALMGEVRVQLPPGRPPRYCVADIDRLMARSAPKGGGA
jgi:hypothetical protein